MTGSVAWISIAPVKGLGLVALERAHLHGHGVSEDRRFHVVDQRGRLINGKRHGALVQVVPEYDDEAQTLALRFPDGTVAASAVELGGPLGTIFYGRPVPGRLVEGPFNEALSAFAGEPLRLVRSDEPGAAIDRGTGGAVSVVSVAALEEIARHAGREEPLDERRFRMLLGIDGVPAHAEDGWLGREVRLGGAVVRIRGNVGRCLVTSQDPDTGVRSDVDVLATLRAYRGDVDTTEPLPFGVVGRVVTPGPVAVGDPVEV